MGKVCVRICICLFLLALGPRVIAQQINISGLEQLYGAVNNPGYAGATLVLSPGIYMLSTTDPNGALRPNGGRIELQRGMSLIGVEGSRGAVIISALNLPASSFPQTVNGVATGPSAAIRMGLGNNSLQWLTVRDGKFAGANIDSGLQPLDLGPASILIAHVDSTGSARGLNLLNFGTKSAGQTLNAYITDCNFFSNGFGQSQGVRVGNFQGANGSIVNVQLSGNSSYGQKVGMVIANNLTTGSHVNVSSSGDQFYADGAGMTILGGASSNDTRADGNTINFEAMGDQFVGNTAASEFDHGGLLVFGTDNTSSSTGGGSGNAVNVQLSGCTILNNDTVDLEGIGARSVPDSTADLSQNNHVIIVESNSSGNGQSKELFDNSLPAIPSYGNSVTVIH